MSSSAAEPALYLTDRELAKKVGLSVQTLARWRIEGGGPPFVVFGPKAIRYRLADVEAWASARTFPHLAAARAHKSQGKAA